MTDKDSKESKICPIMSISKQHECIEEKCSWWIINRKAKFTKNDNGKDKTKTVVFYSGQEMIIINEGCCALLLITEKLVKLLNDKGDY
jgi:hypothetical protein